MANYIALVNWTTEGIGAFAETTKRVDEAEALAKSMGVEIKDIYWCMGHHDLVAVLDAPDDETATAFALRLGAGGAVRTTTMRAFTRDEMDGILAKAG